MMEPKQCEHVVCGDCGMPLHDNLNGPCACGAWHRENEIPALESRITELEQERDRLRLAAKNYAYDACYECGEGQCNKPFHAALLAALADEPVSKEAE